MLYVENYGLGDGVGESHCHNIQVLSFISIESYVKKSNRNRKASYVPYQSGAVCL
jgi:hypothetical protein